MNRTEEQKMLADWLDKHGGKLLWTTQVITIGLLHAFRLGGQTHLVLQYECPDDFQKCDVFISADGLKGALAMID